MRRAVVVVCVAAVAAVSSATPASVDCASPPQSGYPFCDPSLDLDARVDDLMARLSDDEVIAQTSSMAAAIPRLGINAYNWRSNCVHGWTNGPDPWPAGTCWTVFPNPMLMGATFDTDLVLQAGQVTAEEGACVWCDRADNVAICCKGNVARAWRGWCSVDGGLCIALAAMLFGVSHWLNERVYGPPPLPVPFPHQAARCTILRCKSSTAAAPRPAA